MTIDCEVSLKSLLFVAESLDQLLGKHGAQAVLRTAGQRAAANLIDMLPLTLPEDEAARRSGMMLVELGFLQSAELVSENEMRVTGNQVILELQALGLEKVQCMRFYVVGLFEGFFKQMSGSKKKVAAIEASQDSETWRLE